jgi:D-alanyl-D-alanine carboxypeptidase
MRRERLPSVLVGVWVPGEGSYVAARGLADLHRDLPRQAGFPFRIASVTKTFIGTAVLQLVDQERLRKSDKLARWYPSFPNANRISIENLLEMRSGIADSADEAFLHEWFLNPLAPITVDDMIRRAARKAALFEPPDTKTRYTNVNYILLGEIVRKITGRSLHHQLERGIFRPLEMTRTLYPTDERLPGPLRGYSLNPRSGRFLDKTVLDPAPAGGAGAMISTLRDLRRYAKALCTGGLLKPATQRARLRGTTIDGEPDFVRYGEGVELLGPFCGHNGTIFGFSTEMFYLPAKDAVIVINVNRLDEDDQSKSGNLFAVLTKILFPRLVPW